MYGATTPVSGEGDDIHLTLQPKGRSPSFTFVCLGVGGGPFESDCSCYMLKPGDQAWEQGCIVVEGGSWLGALARVLEQDPPGSPFDDVSFPYAAAELRAGYLGSFAKAFLITHAHLDHILGMVLGSASLPGKRNIYGLRSTLENIMRVFDGRIWPRLASWQQNEPHTLFHMRELQTSVSAQVDESFSVLTFALSHGLNPSVPPAPPTPRHHSLQGASNGPPTRFQKRHSLPQGGSTYNTHEAPDHGGPPGGQERPIFKSPFAPERIIEGQTFLGVGSEATAQSSAGPSAKAQAISSPIESIHLVDVPALPRSFQHTAMARSPAKAPSVRGRPSGTGRPSTAQGSERAELDSSPADGSRVARSSNAAAASALDSTAFFITNRRTGEDVLFFGDVEPDKISLSSRNRSVWQHAAHRLVMGQLRCMFLECSFPASHPDEFLYGHLSVPHLLEEMQVLARIVVSERRRRHMVRRESQTSKHQAGSVREIPRLPSLPPSAPGELSAKDLRESLRGLTVVIIHVKTAIFPSYDESSDANAPVGCAVEHSEALRHRMVDPRTMRERILQELREGEERLSLGVRYELAKQGRRIGAWRPVVLAQLQDRKL